MASLYAPTISNEQLLASFNLRHKKINLDYQYMSSFPYDNIKLLSNINWTTISFTKHDVDRLNNVQGIYMFTFNPYAFSMSNRVSDIILYIGQATDLKVRLNKYFYYPNSKKASDQERRFMVLFFSNFLKVHFFETITYSQSDLDSLEYGLIDSILPPFNLKFHSEFAQAYRRILN
ncbi:MAG: GIY-YIG nuclease family protein [Lentimicrobium sp.]|uniref:GIY-YIG nuclease family protein n=1 Tax=Lentimicrobium sp. TaxID=2034841 RepID=UPI0025F7CC73|nr:GIY-YIG nuclease family protein [Lentimicrobium sp.]MCO5257553.1 GIY-YIG nuclease family protein [Lentimicrobium sp.]